MTLFWGRNARKWFFSSRARAERSPVFPGETAPSFRTGTKPNRRLASRRRLWRGPAKSGTGKQMLNDDGPTWFLPLLLIGLSMTMIGAGCILANPTTIAGIIAASGTAVIGLVLLARFPSLFGFALFQTAQAAWPVVYTLTLAMGALFVALLIAAVLEFNLACIAILVFICWISYQSANRIPAPPEWYGRMRCSECDYEWKSRRPTPPRTMPKLQPSQHCPENGVDRWRQIVPIIATAPGRQFNARIFPLPRPTRGQERFRPRRSPPWCMPTSGPPKQTSGLRLDLADRQGADRQGAGTTSRLERFNNTLRQWRSRLIRKPLSFSKCPSGWPEPSSTSSTAAMHPYYFGTTSLGVDGEAARSSDCSNPGWVRQRCVAQNCCSPRGGRFCMFFVITGAFALAAGPDNHLFVIAFYGRGTV